MNTAMLRGFNLTINEISKQNCLDLPKFGENIKSKEISTFEEADKKLNDKSDGFVEPHAVKGYTRADGTQVRGYWRDGDGDPSTNLTLEQGGGYYK